MKKLLLILLLYILVEGNNIIGDGLYVYHRGQHAIEELATTVDEYYPKVQAIDTIVSNALTKELYQQRADTIQSDTVKRRRRIIQR